MARLREWAILYHDGATFTNLDGYPIEAPRNGVMEVFYCSEDTGVSVESSNEGLWIWRDGMWMGTDTFGWHDYLFHDPGPLITLFGRTVKDEKWQAHVHRVALEVMQTPKSAWRARERRY